MFNIFKKKKKVVTRFAPSPTGVLHIGGVRTALFTYLYAKQNNGKFILRIEDTDKERSEKKYEDGIIESLSWLGLNHNELYRQSDRGDIYRTYLDKLIDQGLAFEAEENKSGTGKVIRFKNPNKDITFQDMIVGEVTFNTEELGDFVIARDIDSPVYHFVVVVDDGDMEVTHVIRGQEHLNSTARQIVILEALGFERPRYAHIPLIMSPTGGKLSKRDPDVMSVLEYRDNGYLKDAIINFLGFIGWHPVDDQELMNMEQLMREFTLERVQKGGATFDSKKLKWINKQYIKKLSTDKLIQKVKDFVSQDFFSKINPEKIEEVVGALTERMDFFGELKAQESSGEFEYLVSNPVYDSEKLTMKKSTKEDTLRHLNYIQKVFIDIDSFDKESIKNSIWDYATEEGRGAVLWPLRYCLSGRDRSVDPFAIAGIIGKESTLTRIEKAISMLQ